MGKKNYKYRIVARVELEAETPLIIGSGNKEIYTDASVAKDVNGMPYIPGTSISGVVRHALGLAGKINDFFGFQEDDKGRGSEIIFSEAKMIGKEGVAVDGMTFLDDEFYDAFRNLPIRQHVRITDKGVGANHGKFDEEIVYKGTRFCFEIEVLSETEKNDRFFDVLNTIWSSEFRIGGGSRKGFGKMKVIDCKFRLFNLQNSEDLSSYLEHTSDLSQPFDGDDYKGESTFVAVKYELTLKPQDFFLFGAGFGDKDVNLVPVKEKVVDYKQKEVVDVNVLIPASSIKGALAHRVAYHFNKMKKRFAENASKDDMVAWTTNNEAVVALFGSADPDVEKRGNVLFEDVIEDNKAVSKKIFNHVSIDRFTGGAIDDALFSEKAAFGNGQSFKTTITLLKTDFECPEIIVAFETALNDVINGRLPLGGGVNKGYGCFEGTILKMERK